MNQAKRTRKWLLAYQLKFNGETYKAIAEQTGIAVPTLEKNLGFSGKRYGDYSEWCDEQIKYIKKEAIQRNSKRINEAMTVYEVALTMVTKRPDVALRAAGDIIRRAGLEPPKRIQVDDPQDKSEEIAKYFEQEEEKKDNGNE